MDDPDVTDNPNPLGRAPLLRFSVRLPDGEEFLLLVQTSPNMRCEALKQLLESSLCRHGFSPLHADRMRLIYRKKEMRDTTLLSDYAFSLTEPEPIEVIVKVSGMSIMAPPRLFEYREFVRQVSPANGATGVPCRSQIYIQFGSNHAGYCLSLAHLRDSSSSIGASPDPRFGDMISQHNGDVHAARDRGFVQWTSERYPQRIMLLQIEPTMAARMFPPSRRPIKSYSPTKTRTTDREVAPTVSTTFLDSKRYWHCGVNEGYLGGDFHSWQRYTTANPVDATISETKWPVPGLNDTAYATEPTLAPVWNPSHLPLQEASEVADLSASSTTTPTLVPLLGSDCEIDSASCVADELTSLTTITIKPMEPLLPATTYAVLLMNSAPTIPVADSLASWAAFSGTGIVAEDSLFHFTTE